ncbi:MAG: bifunctional phosphopantothenoylcysteine decarboxylase/phosphopantothenate--cysteine ligase CoaBC [Deltaproteobacteria bacterium HGW-Deltaproteobacteria-21]|nr:MAG: bifunctional phosphopantothenoylcysteine decarboxylase/phosphopantothenate--cysteine ligase CoaBC [Deltaproteobacteria bacterium HGW-Deltaproteobacteria-21]
MTGKKVIVGVTGGIAAYKAAELVRLLVRSGVNTHVAMTEHATKFVAPLTFEALSGNRVVWDMWSHETSPMDHIHWGQESDLVVIAPATANFVAKMANGMGDDFLSTMVLAATAKILVCPAMNTRMYMNAAVQRNLRELRDLGMVVMDPSAGELACRTEGPGRLPEPEEIMDRISMLLSTQDLADLKILITAGPTREPIDPVRYLTNRSSGKMGFALAGAAAMRGAKVVLVSGPTSLCPPSGVTFAPVNTTEEMRREVLGRSRDCDVVIKAAAVLDYRPKNPADRKIKKEPRSFSVELEPTPDILAELGSGNLGGHRILVGFAAETNDLLANAKTKLKKKNLDMIVANDVSRTDAGFDTETNLVKVVYRGGVIEDLPLMSKRQLADCLLDRIRKIWESAK